MLSKSSLFFRTYVVCVHPLAFFCRSAQACLLMIEHVLASLFGQLCPSWCFSLLFLIGADALLVCCSLTCRMTSCKPAAKCMLCILDLHEAHLFLLQNANRRCQPKKPAQDQLSKEDDKDVWKQEKYKGRINKQAKQGRTCGQGKGQT